MKIFSEINEIYRYRELQKHVSSNIKVLDAVRMGNLYAFTYVNLNDRCKGNSPMHGYDVIGEVTSLDVS